MTQCRTGTVQTRTFTRRRTNFTTSDLAVQRYNAMQRSVDRRTAAAVVGIRYIIILFSLHRAAAAAAVYGVTRWLLDLWGRVRKYENENPRPPCTITIRPSKKTVRRRFPDGSKPISVRAYPRYFIYFIVLQYAAAGTSYEKRNDFI